jgi:hypothetical protein
MYAVDLAARSSSRSSDQAFEVVSLAEAGVLIAKGHCSAQVRLHLRFILGLEHVGIEFNGYRPLKAVLCQPLQQCCQR